MGLAGDAIIDEGEKRSQDIVSKHVFATHSQIHARSFSHLVWEFIYRGITVDGKSNVKNRGR